MKWTNRRSGGQKALFCPACQHVSPDLADRSLCAFCGEPLVPQGYCPVCERHLPRPAGALCPKHDIELEEFEPDHRDDPRAAESISWVTVAVYPSSQYAAAARIRLEAEGIPTFVDDERMASAGMYRQATGGAKLQVTAEHAADARVILAQSWALPADETADFDELL